MRVKAVCIVLLHPLKELFSEIIKPMSSSDYSNDEVFHLPLFQSDQNLYTRLDTKEFSYNLVVQFDIPTLRIRRDVALQRHRNLYEIFYTAHFQHLVNPIAVDTGLRPSRNVDPHNGILITNEAAMPKGDDILRKDKVISGTKKKRRVESTGWQTSHIGEDMYSSDTSHSGSTSSPQDAVGIFGQEDYELLLIPNQSGIDHMKECELPDTPKKRFKYQDTAGRTRNLHSCKTVESSRIYKRRDGARQLKLDYVACPSRDVFLNTKPLGATDVDTKYDGALGLGYGRTCNGIPQFFQDLWPESTTIYARVREKSVENSVISLEASLKPMNTAVYFFKALHGGSFIVPISSISLGPGLSNSKDKRSFKFKLHQEGTVLSKSIVGLIMSHMNLESDSMFDCAENSTFPDVNIIPANSIKPKDQFPTTNMVLVITHEMYLQRHADGIHCGFKTDGGHSYTTYIGREIALHYQLTYYYSTRLFMNNAIGLVFPH